MNAQKGLTLVELMVVVCVICIVLALVASLFVSKRFSFDPDSPVICEDGYKVIRKNGVSYRLTNPKGEQIECTVTPTA